MKIKKILAVAIIISVVTLIFAKGSSGPIEPETRLIIVHAPFGVCGTSYRANTTDCCVFDFNNPTGTFSIGDLTELISKANGTCLYDRLVPFPGGSSCWHGSMSLESVSGNWKSSFDLTDRTKVSVVPSVDLLVRIKTNETVIAKLTVFEPCLTSFCRRRVTTPRVIWTSEAWIRPSETTPIDMLLTETGRNTEGLCN